MMYYNAAVLGAMAAALLGAAIGWDEAFMVMLMLFIVSITATMIRSRMLLAKAGKLLDKVQVAAENGLRLSDETLAKIQAHKESVRDQIAAGCEREHADDIEPDPTAPLGGSRSGYDD